METTKTLRMMPSKEIAATPVVALTGNVSDEDIYACYAANMNAFLPKPIDPERLEEILGNVSQKNYEQDIILPEPVAFEDVRKPEVDDGIEAEEPVADAVEEPTKGDLGDQPSDNIAPIHQFLSEQPSQEAETEPEVAALEAFDSFEDAQEPEAKIETQESVEHEVTENVDDADQVINAVMIQNLRDSLGEEQFAELMGGFWEKAEELIVALNEAAGRLDLDVMVLRSHELKGMAGNFGFIELAEISHIIEDSAKADESAPAIKAIGDLPAAYERARDAAA